MLPRSILVAVLLTGVTPAVAAEPPALVLTSPELSVEVGADFPLVHRYTDRATGATLDGRTGGLDQITINGAAHRVTGQGSVSGNVARYRLTVDDQPGVVIDASLRVDGRATTFRIDRITDTDQFRVGTLDLPGHDLVSVSSGQPGAGTAFTTLDPNATRTADVFAPVTPETAAEPNPVGASYGIVHTGSLAAAVETNSVYDKPSGATNGDDARLWHQARKDGDGTRVGVWSGQWTYRAEGSAATEELPWAKVVVTPEVNGDGKVDWQDGAIAFRDIAITAPGAAKTPDRVITHIPFNFASQATHPFLRTLDDVKRISLATDGLGQLAVLKGYGSEGHDSAHPDYGGNYNERAGGLADLNTLAAEGEKFNADFGVHVNATESYPEAKAFSEQLVDLDRAGWNWLDQSREIDQRRDNASGELAKRFRQLREETHPNLDFLYIDVFRNHGYVADHMLRELRDQGWTVGTEWSDKLERSSLWSHWANDLDYGGQTNKGLNSRIIRFIRNDQRDTWNPHPILGNTRIEEFEGWTGETDWTSFHRNIWVHNLPAKFLQQQRITRWDEHEITFTGGVRGTDAAGKREIFAGDAKVLDGDKYLLPWKGKYYHYNPAGGRTEWTVPDERELTMYRLTDTGREAVGVVRPQHGKVTLDAEPGVPYVLDGPGGRTADPRWGEGTGLVDPGFNAADLRRWRPQGDVHAERTALGHTVARFDGLGALEQRLTGLEPGTYSASVWVESPQRTELTVGNTKNFIDRSTAKNYVAADEKQGTYFQRLRVVFDVAAGEQPNLRITGGAGVRVDDVRVVPTERVAGPGIVNEDFEHVDQGWGPFVKGDAGGSTDPRTHLSELHAPYTQRGWHGKLVDDVLSGNWSLKAHEENAGLVYRTVPQTVRFEPGHRYRVEFSYQNGHAGQYSWITGSGTAEQATPLPAQHQTARFAQEFTVDGPDAWVGLRKHDVPTPLQADLVMDDFTVFDLGLAG
ncbi:endo-alpha-N-acetylgalactosaminidase family protein [Amycolatopsis albispora]|uniref:Endo-alpha-N-acetylgalactosaminidase n=1 Tax=Amycolatopsis albispora TaxID=1804986 RepID=A0A344LJZ5_9PSEU|nr:endo-alpha-N-acetylgalactosaminidase family protein [Amycolatopsis albispora]AXB48369.1 hypothetical protein A4R43_09090 [Amycolatopsis albispora]